MASWELQLDSSRAMLASEFGVRVASEAEFGSICRMRTLSPNRLSAIVEYAWAALLESSSLATIRQPPTA